MTQNPLRGWQVDRATIRCAACSAASMGRGPNPSTLAPPTATSNEVRMDANEEWLYAPWDGQPDIRGAYIGSLRGTTLPSFRSPVAGLPPAHWNDTRRQT
jgi:hypothetical protein